jgi:RecB family exonuclease
VITPRRTRLIRVADLHQFRQVVTALLTGPIDGLVDASHQVDGREMPPRLVVVPTRGAATTLSRTVWPAGAATNGRRDRLVTRDELYDALHARLAAPPRRLSAFERDGMAQSAAHEAAALAGDLPFRIRPGLVAEVLRFYDQLRRQSQSVKRFEELIVEALGGGELDDRGADRLLRQTRFLAETFRGYERRAAASDGIDEHRLRELLLSDAPALPLAHIVVTVSDWIADPAGLHVADFDLLNRLPNLAAIDIVSTDAALASGFHERLDRWWPGLETMTADACIGRQTPVRPRLVCPVPDGDAAPLWFTHRDREEELIAVTRRLAGEPPSSFDDVAVVFKQPLPYLYLAPETFGAAGIPFVVADALPLAAEPVAAAVDLVLDAIEADFPRDALVALLRSPHFAYAQACDGGAIAALDRALSEARYLGGADRLRQLAQTWTASTGRRSSLRQQAAPALHRAAEAAEELAQFRTVQPASVLLERLREYLERQLSALEASHPQFERERRARAAVLGILRDMAAAHRDHYDPEWSGVELATAVRRWLGDATFIPESASAGVRLLDDQAARYGAFDDITVVGLVETEWPERPRRNIFYPPGLLKALGWPSEKDRHGAADARFLDLLASAGSRVELSVFLLDDESIVSRSIQLDEVARARLSTSTRAAATEPLLAAERLALQSELDAGASAETRAWFDLRSARSPADEPIYHGSTGPRSDAAWSVSALETYIGCPFKFFAQHVLRLEEEPDDEEVMDPRRQGQFVHEVFETFFREWQDAGRRAVTSADLPAAREMFVSVVDRALERIPEGEAALERTRLLGSPAAAGLGEAVFRMEAERSVPVVRRLLEHRLEGPVAIQTADGPRTISIRGKADRIDLLADGTFRLIDYKLGWSPDRSRALQLPIYAICAEQQLHEQGRAWTLGEAVYLAFKGPKRVVPLFANDNSRVEALARAQQRLADTIDAIARGEFPPTPDDVYRCETCSYAAVCRKDYVGDI